LFDRALITEVTTMPATKKNAPSRAGKPVDAIALLKADHRQVAAWFEEFDVARSASRKARLAEQICSALDVHSRLEEEIFYPAFLEATKDKDLHHEAVVEHGAAKQLLAEIQASSPADDYFDARVKVLAEMIRHHVKEEEQPGGMFAQSRKRRMDLVALGERMAARKVELGARSPEGRGFLQTLTKVVSLGAGA
jgi:Hemerythrin HHE cation binding domain